MPLSLKDCQKYKEMGMNQLPMQANYRDGSGATVKIPTLEEQIKFAVEMAKEISNPKVESICLDVNLDGSCDAYLSYENFSGEVNEDKSDPQQAVFKLTEYMWGNRNE